VSLILGCDTSLANFGWCLADLDDSGELVFRRAGCFSTETGEAERRGDDTTRRIMELHRRLRALVKEPDSRPSVVAVEALALPFGRTSMVTVSQCARARTLVDVLASDLGCFLLERSPSAVKKAATGITPKKGQRITKEMVQDGLFRDHPSAREACRLLQPHQVEHAADACAVVLAALPRLVAWGAEWE
jgi:Holliday junction resolvasome RuvABC endonuclease subunit